MAKAITVDRESIAEKLKTKTIKDVIKWAIDNGGEPSPFASVIAELEKTRDDKTTDEGAKKTAMEAIDNLTKDSTRQNAPIYKMVAEAIKDVAGATVPLVVGTEGGAKRGRKAGGGSTPAATFTGDVDKVLAFIKDDAGDKGVPTRRLSANFGKADWETLLDGKAKGTGKPGVTRKWWPK